MTKKLPRDEYLQLLHSAPTKSIGSQVEEDGRFYVQVTVGTENFLVLANKLAFLDLDACADDKEISAEVFKSLFIIKRACKKIAQEERVRASS
jgi:hypothetical protein